MTYVGVMERTANSAVRIERDGQAVTDGDDRSIVSTAVETDRLDLDMMEALFFAYRDFISSADRELASLGLGRAHHRVLHFVNRKPGLSVAELLEPLAITKQSLARTLKQLIDAGLIAQRTASDDRRQRHLYPTRAGRKLMLELAEPQSRRITRSLQALGSGIVAQSDPRSFVRAFLRGMVEPASPLAKPRGELDGDDPTGRTRDATDPTARNDAHDRGIRDAQGDRP